MGTIRIRSLRTEKDLNLWVTFDDGYECIYDIKDDIPYYPALRQLLMIPGLFNSVRLDESRTCVYWNEEIDLPSDIIREYGRRVL